MISIRRRRNCDMDETYAELTFNTPDTGHLPEQKNEIAQLADRIIRIEDGRISE